MDSQPNTRNEAVSPFVEAATQLFHMIFKFQSADELGGDEKCHICHEPFSSHDNPESPVKLSCGNIIGLACALRWLLPRSGLVPDLCPFCRQSLFLSRPTHIDPQDRSPHPNIGNWNALQSQKSDHVSSKLMDCLVYAVAYALWVSVLALVLGWIVKDLFEPSWHSFESHHEYFEARTEFKDFLFGGQLCIFFTILYWKACQEAKRWLESKGYSF